MKRKTDCLHSLSDEFPSSPPQVRRIPHSISLPLLHIPTTFTSITPLCPVDAQRDDISLSEQCTPKASFAVASRRGARPVMQDCAAFSTSHSRYTFVLCDGHGSEGYAAAHLACQYLNNSLDKISRLRTAQSIGDLFCKADAKCMESVACGGTTATVCTFSPSTRRLLVANVGDSRCVIGKTSTAVALSVDHSPALPSERERINALGGCVHMKHGVARVDGLSVSRALGDRQAKVRGYVSSEPSLTEVQVTSEDEFVIIASDGVWSVLSSHRAADIVRTSLKLSSASGHTDSHTRTHSHSQAESRTVATTAAGRAACALIDAALCAGSTDNVSAIVFSLSPLICTAPPDSSLISTPVSQNNSSPVFSSGIAADLSSLGAFPPSAPSSLTRTTCGTGLTISEPALGRSQVSPLVTLVSPPRNKMRSKSESAINATHSSSSSSSSSPSSSSSSSLSSLSSVSPLSVRVSPLPLPLRLHTAPSTALTPGPRARMHTQPEAAQSRTPLGANSLPPLGFSSSLPVRFFATPSPSPTASSSHSPPSSPTVSLSPSLLSLSPLSLSRQNLSVTTIVPSVPPTPAAPLSCRQSLAFPVVPSPQSSPSGIDTSSTPSLVFPPLTPLSSSSSSSSNPLSLSLSLSRRAVTSGTLNCASGLQRGAVKRASVFTYPALA